MNKNIIKYNLNQKQMPKKLTIKEKLMLRICMVFVILIISLLSFSNRANAIIKDNEKEIEKVFSDTLNQISIMESDLKLIYEKIDEYESLIKSVKSLTQIEQDSQNNRIISRYSVPNLLNQVMNLIPKEVRIISIINKNDSSQILIEAESEKYEQLGYFFSTLKNEKVLNNIKSTNGIKTENIIKIIIEGDLP